MLRIAYVCEFLLALLTISVAWGQVGGQDHLDLLPWYDKFVLLFALALTVVLGTAAAVSREPAWNGTTMICLTLALLLVFAMGALTYYYHLHEDEDQGAGNNAGVALTLTQVAARLCT